MVSGGSIRFLLAPVGALLLLMTFSLAPVMAADTDCPVRVTPRAAPAGTVFHFNGTGQAPTGLTIQKGSAEPIGHTLDLDNDDEWDVTVTSRPGDEGLWAATFWQKTDACATLNFRVTLSNTDVASDVAASTSENTSQPVLLYLAVVAVGLGGGLFIGRLRRSGSHI